MLTALQTPQNVRLSLGEMSFWAFVALMVEDDADAKSEVC